MLAEEQEESSLRLQAHHAMWTTHFRLSEFVACHLHAEQGIALYDMDKHRSHVFRYGGHDPGVCAYNHVCKSLWFLGFPDQARRIADESVDLAMRLSHPFSLALAFVFSAFVHQYCRDVRRVREHAEAAMSLCAERGVAPECAATGQILCGWALATGGHGREGFEAMQGGFRAMRAIGRRAHEPYLLALLAEAHANAAQPDEGLSVITAALKAVEETGERTFEAEIHRLKGELLLKQSEKNREEAASCYYRAAETARGQQSKSLELRAAMSLARVPFDGARRSEIRAMLASIYDSFSEGFDTPDLREARVLLGERE